MKRFGGHHGTQKAPKMDPQIVFERPKWNKNSINSGHSLENGSRCYWEPSGHPFWSPYGANWAPIGDGNGCNLEAKVKVFPRLFVQRPGEHQRQPATDSSRPTRIHHGTQMDPMEISCRSVSTCLTALPVCLP